MYLKKLQDMPLRFGIFDGKELFFTISKNTKLDFDFEEGEIPKDQSIKVVKAIEFDYLWERITYYLSSSERSPKNLRDWMKKRLLSDEVKDALFQRAEEESFLSQERYVELFVYSHRRSPKKPRWRLLGELRQKGIEEKYLNNIDYDDGLALQFILKNDKKLRGLEKSEKIKKLQTRGFSYYDILDHF